MKKIAPLVLLTALSGCDGLYSKPWREGTPVRISSDWDVPVQVDVITTAITDRLAQFGIPVSETGMYNIHVSYDARCVCAGCVMNTVAYTTNGINVCASISDTVLKTDKGPYLVIGHEVGHILGLHTHLPANGKNLMAPVLDYYKDVSGFSVDDIKAICASGYVESSVCH